MGFVNFRRALEYQNVLNVPQNFDEDFKLWRYLSLPKFLKLLEDQFLYLARLTDFEDPFEGTFPKTYPRAVQTFAERYDLPERIAEHLGNRLTDVRNYSFVNCWHINENESAAMWSIYSKTNESVAIQSSFQRLHQEVGEQAMLGSVEYIDYENDYIPTSNMHYHCLCKRKSYSYEKEFRVIHYDMGNQFGEQNPERFKTVNIDLDNLVENVYISPNSANYFKELVESISNRYDHDFNVKMSSINRDPFY